MKVCCCSSSSTLTRSLPSYTVPKQAKLIQLASVYSPLTETIQTLGTLSSYQPIAGKRLASMPPSEESCIRPTCLSAAKPILI